MLALALVLEGASRRSARAGHGPADAPDWVHADKEGLPGLHDRAGPGRGLGLGARAGGDWKPRRGAGPDPDRDGVVRSASGRPEGPDRGPFAVRLHERSVGKVLRRLGFGRVSVRPRHPKADEAAQEAFKARRAGPRGASRARPRQAGRGLVLGQARVGQQGTLTRVWARRGTRPASAPRPSPRGLRSARSPSAPSAPPWSCLTPTPRHRPAPRRGRPRGRARGRGGRARPRRLSTAPATSR